MAGPSIHPEPDRGKTDIVLVVPGLDTSRLGHTLDLLLDYLDLHLRSKPGVTNVVITSRQGEGVGQAAVRFRRPDGSEKRIDLRELGWSDVRPSIGDASIYVRLLRGTVLIRYWIGAWAFGRMPPTSASMRRSTMFSCFFLGSWYLLVLVAAGHLLVTNFDLFAAFAGSLEATWIWKIMWVLILGLLGSETMTKGLNHSWGAYSFMTDKDSFRRKTRTRLLGMLAHIAEETRPAEAAKSIDRVVILAHSMGSVVAIDALEAAAGLAGDLPQVDLITLGSPFEFLALRQPALNAVVERCVRSPLIRTWQDYFDADDAYCSRVPVAAEDDPKFGSHQINLQRPFGEALGMLDRHNAYLKFPDVLDLIAGFPTPEAA